MSQKSEKQKLEAWKKFTEGIRNATPIDTSETTHARLERIKHLEANREEWFKYYFSKFAFAEPNQFHINSSDRIFEAYDRMAAKGSGKFYQSRIWARGLSKSTRRMMEIFYLFFAKKFRANMLLVSKSEGNALKLLKPYRGHLEANQRIIQDYGKQESIGSWETGEFTTLDGKSFLAVGRKQSPRGSKDEELRVNIIVFDDTDDDELCRNADLVQEAWDWIEQAVIPCVEISRPYFIFFDNNLIAEDSLTKRASLKANDCEIINIRDASGKSTWWQKNTEEMIEDMFDNLSEASIQKEYYNNPLKTGKSVPEITWGKCPPLKELPFVVTYTDPSPSNKDHPGQKSGASNSRKAVFIVGRKGRRYFVYYGFLDMMGSETLIESMYLCRDFVDRQTIEYNYIENNTLQDPVYSQVYLPLIFEMGVHHPKGILSIIPDDRKKLDKWFRIEATLQPINRRGDLIFNEDEKGNPHMLRLEQHFKSASANSKQLDGPDCIEGAVKIIDTKLDETFSDNNVQFQKRERSNSKHY